MDTFTAAELAYLATQRLGRLATIDGRGAPQNSAVGFVVEDDGVVVVSGRDLGNSRKFRNVEGNDRVSFLVDDIASFDPWVVRAVEIRGRAEALRGVTSTRPGLSPEQIRIHPERIISFGLEPAAG